MDSKGYISATCLPVETATNGEPAWIAIGQQLALKWQAMSELPYYVMTCVKTKPTNSGQVALVFLAGYDSFPRCQLSNGPQEIAGIAMLETTIRDIFQDGVFMLTLFADKTVPKTQTHTNSDGSTTELIATINHMLIATNASVMNNPIGMNGVQSFTPLGNYFKVSKFAVVLDITNQVDSMTGWNIGRLSGKAVAVSWNYIYTMDNYVELTCLQLGFLIIGALLISGDFYLSTIGLKRSLRPMSRSTSTLLG
ncbi:hypothetical protein LEN26_004642 [Aphanomyces euteiches]|nr:hypothetical protein LEN26_004642 [Aphanomyces euteiches]